MMENQPKQGRICNKQKMWQQVIKNLNSTLSKRKGILVVSKISPKLLRKI